MMIIRILANDITKNELQSEMKLCVYKPKNAKILISSIFSLIVCLTLHAEHQPLQPEIFSDSSSCIYIADNAEIYGKEYMVVEQDTSQVLTENTVKTKHITTETAKNNNNDDNIDKKEPQVVAFPSFPSIPHSLYYLDIDNNPAAKISKRKFYRFLPVYMANRGNDYLNIRTLNLAINLLKQRQKLSITAIQCGLLTSFSPNSPSFLISQSIA